MFDFRQGLRLFLPSPLFILHVHVDKSENEYIYSYFQIPRISLLFQIIFR